MAAPHLSRLDPSLLPPMENIVFPRFARGAGRRQTAELFTTRDGFRWEPDSPRQKVVGRERWWSQSETEGSVASKSQVCVPNTLSAFAGHVQRACGWIFIGKVRRVESMSRGIDTPLQREACNIGRGALRYPGESFQPSWDSEQVHTDLWEAEGIRQHLDYLEKTFHLTFFRHLLPFSSSPLLAFLGSSSCQLPSNPVNLGLAGNVVGQISKGILTILISLEAGIALTQWHGNQRTNKATIAGREGRRLMGLRKKSFPTSWRECIWMNIIWYDMNISTPHFYSPCLAVGVISSPRENHGPHSPQFCNSSNGISP